MSEEIDYRSPPRSRVERILGGRPGSVMIRLLLVSLAVGFLMTVFGLDVYDIFEGAIEMVEDAFRDGSGIIRTVIGYILTGAAIVVPVWIVLRLTRVR